MAVGHLKTIECLEELDPASMRFSDVAQIIRLHMDAVVKLGSGDERRREDDWTEEDDEMLEQIIEEIEAEEQHEENSGEDPKEDWEA